METGNSKLETRQPRKLRFSFSNFQFPFSGFPRRVARWLVVTIAVATGVAWTVAAYAQGCPLCANTVSAAKASALLALRNGILILIIPPLAICVGILWLGIKARNRFHEPEELPAGTDKELVEMLAQIEPVEESGQSQRVAED